MIVAGGGPAGLIAARDLASAGHAVCLLEEHPSIGEPVHCTGLLGMDAFGELQISRTSIWRVTHAARFHAASGRSVLVETDKVAAAIVDRARFDATLAAEASAAGVDVRTNARVTDIQQRPSGVTVSVVEAGRPTRLTARACVLACGANYRLNRRLGLGIPRVFVQSAQIETRFSEVSDVQVYFGHDIAPQGFAWLVPFHRDGVPSARIGLMCESRAAVRFEALARAVGREFAYDGAIGPPRLKVLPLAPVPKTYGLRLIAAGDAAGLVKPTTGGGIYYSLLSGRMAAEVLDAGLRRDALGEADMARYEARWRERLGPDIRAGLAFRRLASRLNDRAIDAIVELASIDGLLPILRQVADFNWHRGAVIALLRHAGFRRILLNAMWG